MWLREISLNHEPTLIAAVLPNLSKSNAVLVSFEPMINLIAEDQLGDVPLVLDALLVTAKPIYGTHANTGIRHCVLRSAVSFRIVATPTGLSELRVIIEKLAIGVRLRVID